MDPNETLRLLRDAVNAWHQANEDEDTADLMNSGYSMAELSNALDEWLSEGGFLPADWVRG